jgi:hypothetical protein
MSSAILPERAPPDRGNRRESIRRLTTDDERLISDSFIEMFQIGSKPNADHRLMGKPPLR